MARRVTAREARAHFAELTDRVRYTGEPVIVAKQGQPFVALVSLEDLDLVLPEQVIAEAPETIRHRRWEEAAGSQGTRRPAHERPGAGGGLLVAREHGRGARLHRRRPVLWERRVGDRSPVEVYIHSAWFSPCDLYPYPDVHSAPPSSPYICRVPSIEHVPVLLFMGTTDCGGAFLSKASLIW